MWLAIKRESDPLKKPLTEGGGFDNILSIERWGKDGLVSTFSWEGLSFGGIRGHFVSITFC